MNREHLLSRGIHWTKFGNFQPKATKDTEQTIFVPRIAVWPWPCNPNINRGLLATSTYWTKFSNFQAKASKDFERITFRTQTSSLTLIFDHVTWKSIRKFFSLETSTATSLATLNQMILGGQYLYKDEQFDLDPWPCDLKSIGNNYSLGASTTPSLANFKHRGQKILSGHHLIYRSTDWPTCGKQHAPFYFKGGIKII